MKRLTFGIGLNCWGIPIYSQDIDQHCYAVGKQCQRNLPKFTTKLFIRIVKNILIHSAW